MEILVTMPDTETRATFFPPAVRDQLDSLGRVVWNPSETDYTAAELQTAIPGGDVLVTTCWYRHCALSASDATGQSRTSTQPSRSAES